MQKLYQSSFIIKILALVTMIIDHVGVIFFPEVWWLRLIGRMSFPLFAYLLATGFERTSNHLHYGLRLGIFALVSQYFYVLAFGYPFVSLNIFVTLFFAFITLYVLTRTNLTLLPKVALAGMLFILSLVIPFEYSIAGILCVVSWYYLKEKKFWLALFQVALWIVFPLLVILSRTTVPPFTDVVFLQMLAPLAIAIVWLIQKNIPQTQVWNITTVKKTIIQYGFYAFYPLHLLVLYLVQKIIQ